MNDICFLSLLGSARSELKLPKNLVFPLRCRNMQKLSREKFTDEVMLCFPDVDIHEDAKDIVNREGKYRQSCILERTLRSSVQRNVEG